MGKGQKESRGQPKHAVLLVEVLEERQLLSALVDVRAPVDVLPSPRYADLLSSPERSSPALVSPGATPTHEIPAKAAALASKLSFVAMDEYSDSWKSSGEELPGSEPAEVTLHATRPVVVEPRLTTEEGFDFQPHGAPTEWMHPVSAFFLLAPAPGLSASEADLQASLLTPASDRIGPVRKVLITPLRTDPPEVSSTPIDQHTARASDAGPGGPSSVGGATGSSGAGDHLARARNVDSGVMMPSIDRQQNLPRPAAEPELTPAPLFAGVLENILPADAAALEEDLQQFMAGLAAQGESLVGQVSESSLYNWLLPAALASAACVEMLRRQLKRHSADRVMYRVHDEESTWSWLSTQFDPDQDELR